MKLFFISLFSLSFVIDSFGQSNVEFQLNGLGSNLAGTTQNINLSPSSPELNDLGNGTGLFEIHYIVTNNTSTNQQWKLTRKKINVPSSWSDQLCWPPQCYVTSGDVYTTPNTGGNPAPILPSGAVYTIIGDNGSMNVTIDGQTYLMSFNTDLLTTVTNFVTSNSSLILTNHNLVVSNQGAELIFSGGNSSELIVFEPLNTTTNHLNFYQPYEMKPRITIDLGAASTGTYRYYVTDAATGTYLDSIDLTINFALAVNPIKQNPTISLSPNPATDNVTVQLGNTETGSVRIVDALGNVVYNEQIANGTKSIDVSNFKNGVYFVIIDPSDAKPVNRKLIIRH
jgi:hypothetical protein